GRRPGGARTRGMVSLARRDRAAVAPGVRRFTGPRALEARGRGPRGGPVLRRVPRTLLAAAGRPLLRCARAVQARLLVGRAGEPRRSLRHAVVARQRVAAQGRAG